MLPLFDDDGLVEARVLGPGHGSWFVAEPLDGSPALDVHAVAPGDRVLLRPRADAPGRAELAALLEPGPQRRTPPCALAGRCGGCHWLHLDDAAQRALRERALDEALSAAGIDLRGVTRASLASPSGLAFRSRMRFQSAFTGDARKIGLHRLGERATLDVPECAVLAPEAARAYGFLRDALRDLRPAGLTGFELTALPGAPGALVYLNPRDAEPEDWPALGEELLAAGAGSIAGIAVRPAASRRGVPDRLGASAVCGRTPAGLPVAAAVRGFVQADLGAAELLARTVVRLAGAGPARRVLELFAGAGFLGWRLAAAGAVVFATEHDPLAAQAAALLPKRGGTLAFATGDARAIFDEHAAAGWDALVADPPRAGLGELAAAIVRAGPPRVVLVSCSVRGLATDAAQLAPAYRLRELVTVEMFKGTRHGETVALFER